jgi:hypothetical protein
MVLESLQKKTHFMVLGILAKESSLYGTWILAKESSLYGTWNLAKESSLYGTWILAKESSLYITSNSQDMVHPFHMYMNKVVNVNCIFLCNFVKICVDWGSSMNRTCHCKLVNNI